jgi:hypothetical protein
MWFNDIDKIVFCIKEKLGFDCPLSRKEKKKKKK